MGALKLGPQIFSIKFFSLDPYLDWDLVTLKYFCILIKIFMMTLRGCLRDWILWVGVC